MGILDQTPLMRAYRGERSSIIPCWFMRQAGRYLPEYRELRKQYSMLELIRKPKLASEVTLQPIRRFEFDGSIIFADILNPLIGMGIELDFVEGHGPKIYNLIREPEDVGKLKVPRAEDNIAYTLEAITLTASELNKHSIPLLGFSGAPFTLSSYLIGESPSVALAPVLSFAERFPESWTSLQWKLTELVSYNLIAQIGAGASAAQLFDTWVGSLSVDQYKALALPFLREIVKSFKAATDAPLIYFGRGSRHLLDEIMTVGFDALSIDWKTPLSDVSRHTNRSIPLQGNLDPEILAGPEDQLRAAVHQVLNEGRQAPAHIFNLGHGILPHTPIDNVTLVRNLVREYAYDL